MAYFAKTYNLKSNTHPIPNSQFLTMTDLRSLTSEAKDAITQAATLAQLEALRVEYLGKQGKITAQMKAIGTLPAEERKAFGAEVNEVRDAVSSQLDAARAKLEEASLAAKLATETLDITAPIRPEAYGSVHPISQVIDECTEIFGRMGFAVAEGPDIETDFHNFGALNIPPEHPARQMHDTFYFPPDESGARHLLRTHTSPVQIRYMQANQPPYKIIAPGRTYRCDSDLTHSPMFHQIEGLWIAKDVTMAQLKGCLTEFVHEFFGSADIPLRFRPSFFPFTEPSAEVDIGCWRENGELKLGTPKDTAQQGWLEVLGCGMVHPNVLKAVNIDPETWQGFAFGVGIERIAMLKYGIPDLRTFFESDARWLQHYSFSTVESA